MESLDPILAQHPFFRSLDVSFREQMVGCAANVRFEKGEYLMREGQDANRFYLIRDGLVAVEQSNPGRESILVETLKEGDILGWSWLVPPYKCRFDSRALAATRAISLDGWCLRKKCDDDHGLGYELLKRISSVIASRLQATRMQLLD
jgi:CRP-like cAMP-binding protein